MKRKRTVKLSAIFLLLVVLFFCAAIIKLSYVALSSKVDDKDLKEFADNRNTTTQTLYAQRGSIYDINNELLAQNVNSYTVIAYLSPSRTTNPNNPKHVVDPAATAAALSPLINMSVESLTKLMSQSGVYQVELGPGGRGISELVKGEIEKLDLPGIGFISSSKRYYKMGSLAPYIIGYAKKNDAGEIIGEMGIEEYYNDSLKGSDGYKIYQKDAYGYQIPNTESYTDEPVSGNNIYLTLDSNIQLIAETALDSLSKYESDWISMTIADAKTGAIVAYAYSPSFNLNSLTDIDSYVSPLVGYSYEPGSTMKIFSFMAAMENGVYKGDERYESGTIEVSDALIKDSNGIGWGYITYDEGFAHSSNVAATKLALKVGASNLQSFYEKLGFGSKTGIELSGEVSGKVSINYQTELANASFGQGITTTQIQTIGALTPLANDGVMLKPYIVSKIVDNDGNVTYEGKRTELGQVVSSSTASKMRELMYNMVYSGYSRTHYYKDGGVTVLGKTATAQIASGGGYLTGTYDYIRSFTGLFPGEDPQYIIYFSAKQFVGPTSEIANTIVNTIEEVAKYKNLTTKDNSLDTSKIIEVTNYINTDTVDTIEKLKQLGLKPVTIGNGKFIINQYPLKGSKVIYGAKIFILTNDYNYVMPDINGWTSSEVITFCNLINLKYNLTGYGSVTSYSIPAGTPIDLNTVLEINLA